MLPTDVRLVGCKINQPDLPWWVLAVSVWLSMVRSIGESHVASWRDMLEVVLEKQPPTKIYELYESYIAAMKAEERKNASRRKS